MGKFEELCDLLPADINWGDNITPEIVEEIVLAEREACAKACELHILESKTREEAHGYAQGNAAIHDCANAIRLRSNV